MSRRAPRIAGLVPAFAALSLLVAAIALAGPGVTGVKLTRIQRVPFPNRGYVLDLPRNVALSSRSVQVTENGKPVQDVAVTPLAGSGVGFGAVLAIDASDSMRGGPYAGAVAAAQSFIAKRGLGEAIGLVAFNSGIHVLQKPSLDASRLRRVLASPPPLATGTRIYDAIGRALRLIAKDKQLSTASIVLLTDGADIGSRASLQNAIAAAQKENVRIFTVGLRSPAFDPSVLQMLAAKTGGAYAEATSPGQLAPIYSTLSNRLAQEYLLQYHSLAKPKTPVHVQVRVKGFATSTDDYTAPTPSGLAPYHESFMTRFLLSGFSLFLLALIVAILIVYVVQGLLNRAQSDLVDRVAAFAGEGLPAAPARSGTAQRRNLRARRRAAATSARGALARLERTVEIADIQLSAPAVVALTIVGTLIVIIVLAVISPVIAVLGLMTPFFARALVLRKLKKVRADFADQLPANLQILASALRSGYSFVAALTTVVEQAQEPTQRELRRVLADVQLAVPMDEALRRAAKRMNSRDLEQVALVAELQLTTGGNVAEVLDVVVGTIRDRQDVRRLLKTLTAQGRMARWILTGLPIVTGLVFYAYQPGIVGPYFARAIGQITLVVAAILVASGSFVIQKIVDIEV